MPECSFENVGGFDAGPFRFGNIESQVFGAQVGLYAGEVLWVSAGRGDIRGGFTHSHILEQGSNALGVLCGD